MCERTLPGEQKPAKEGAKEDVPAAPATHLASKQQCSTSDGQLAGTDVSPVSLGPVGSRSRLGAVQVVEKNRPRERIAGGGSCCAALSYTASLRWAPETVRRGPGVPES